MKNQELNKLANRIAKAEYILQTSHDDALRQRAEADINEVAEQVSFQDLFILDELVQTILKNKLTS